MTLELGKLRNGIVKYGLTDFELSCEECYYCHAVFIKFVERDNKNTKKDMTDCVLFRMRSVQDCVC